MKLSDAIRLGAMLGPQLRGLIGHVRGCDVDMFELIPEWGTCAQGAALVAVEARWCDSETAELRRRWPWVDVWYKCPACSLYAGCSGSKLLAHLNDDHAWARERIADYIATIEPEEPEDDPSQPPPVERLKPESKPEVLCGA